MEEALNAFLRGHSTPLLLILLAAAIAVLVKGADLLVSGAVGLSERFGVPKVIIGATIVSLGTTTPEAAVSVLAAFRGMPDLALGNSVGSIICDTGLIFGLSCLLTRLPMDRFVLKRHGWVQFGSGALLVLLSLLFLNTSTWTSVLPRWMGFLLVALLGVYLAVSLYWARQRQKQTVAAVEEIEVTLTKIPAGRAVPVDLALLAVGLGLVLAGSHFAIPIVRELCLRWGVPASVVSATLVAFGTSLPELVTALMGIYKGHKDLVIGNIIGADILNVLFVTGAAACAAPLEVDSLFFRLHFPVMMAVLILFRLTIWFSKRTFARWMGVVFIALHLGYVAANYVFGRV